MQADDLSSHDREHAAGLFRQGKTTDAEGRSVSLLDPVEIHLLHQGGIIPPSRARQMADELLPGARRQRSMQIMSVLLGFGLVIGGNIVYFSLFSSWSHVDGVMLGFYVVQTAVLLSGPYIAYRLARQKYFARIAEVMLEYDACPHCGYDLRGSPLASDSHQVGCAECGCRWQVQSD